MILAVLQARTSSKRLPNKVLAPILDKPMLLRQVERVLRAKNIDELVIATSDEKEDERLISVCESSGIKHFRGSLNDVLDRMYQASLGFGPEYVVRLTADCPLTDPELIDQVINYFLEGNYDYASNTLNPTWPDGVDVEIMKFNILKEAWENSISKHEREHVTPYIYNHPEKYRLGNYESDEDLSDLRWTVDEPVDLEFVKKIYESLYPRKPEFNTSDILAFLKENPHLNDINSGIERNSGFYN